MDLELWKKRKKELKLTFEDLHAKTGVSVRRLKSLFNEENQGAKTSTVHAIEKALGIYDAKIDISEEEKNLLEKFKKLTKEEKQACLSFMDLVLSKKQ